MNYTSKHGWLFSISSIIAIVSTLVVNCRCFGGHCLQLPDRSWEEVFSNSIWGSSESCRTWIQSAELRRRGLQLPVRYYFAIYYPGVFSLARLSLLIYTGFHVPNATPIVA